MSGDRSETCCTAMRAFTRSRGDPLQDPPPTAGLSGSTPSTERADRSAPFTIGAMPIFYCPWCGTLLPNKREGDLAATAQGGRAPLTPRSFRLVEDAWTPATQLPALRPDSRGSAADSVRGVGGPEQNAWIAEVRGKIAGARGLRTDEARRSRSEDRYNSATLFEGRWYSDTDMLRDGRPDDGAVPSPDSDDRTPYLRRNTSDTLIDRVIFGVFFALGLLATIRFILTH